MMQLWSKVLEMIEKYCVISKSDIYKQHQGFDAIIEEVNKTLKTLIPSIL